MQRRRKRSVALLGFALSLGAPTSAFAFHAGATFEKAPGAGGAGGIYYAGAKIERGWDCRMCHLGSVGQVDLDVRITPTPTTASGDTFYAPGQAYEFEVTLLGEHLGLNRPNYNFNSIVVDVVDESGKRSGNLDGFSSLDFVQANKATIVYGAPPTPGVTSWSFRWTAPETGSGEVTVHLAAVDGDGASGSDDPEATTDPHRDDVVIKALTYREGSVVARGSYGPLGAAAVALLGLAASFLPRRRKRRAERRAQ